MLPRPPPGLTDRRIPLAPFGFELVEPDKGLIGVFRLINRFDPRHDRLAIFPGDEGEAVSDQVNDAGLNQCLRKHRGNSFRKSLQAVHNGDEDIRNATDFQVVHDFKPKLGALRLLDPKTQNFFLALSVQRQRDIDRLVLDEAFIPNFNAQRVEENNRIDGIERSILPVPDLLQNGIGDAADKIRGYIDAIELRQMPLDLAHRHAARVKAQNLIVKAIEPCLALRDELRLKGAGPVAGNENLNFPVLAQKRLRACAVAAITASPSGRVALLVAQMLRQLRAERPLNQSLLKVLEKPIVAGQILRLAIVRQKLIEQIRGYRRLRLHVSSPFRVNLTETYLHCVYDTLRLSKELFEPRPEFPELLAPPGALLEHAALALGEDIDLALLRKKLDADRFLGLAPGLASKSLLKRRQPPLRRANEIAHWRRGRAHLRQRLFGWNAAIHDPDAVRLAVLLFDFRQKIRKCGLVAGVSCQHFVGQRKALGRYDERNHYLHAVRPFVPAVAV